jgi:hypothetical protein
LVSVIGPVSRWVRAHRRLLVIALAAVLFFPLAHIAIDIGTRLRAPHVTLPAEVPPPHVESSAGLQRVYLQGSPEAIGAVHARWLRERMLAQEGELWTQFERHVPWWLARVGIQDYSRLRFMHVDRGVPEARRREIAAMAIELQPDPFLDRMPTYQRMIFLYALYDIALPLEHSPLIGCTSFAFDSEATANGHTLVARAFDFEVDDMLDRDKVVFMVREDGAIPFASVAWPGFVGVVTGMNADGVLVVVHGARGGKTVPEGIPVAFSLREVLQRAHDTAEAVEILKSQNVMVSHIVFVADGAGRFAVVERSPGVPVFVRDAKSHGTIAVTNHFEGPLASDPKNQRVRASTSTVARRARIDELLASIAPHSVTPATALAMLRDHECAGGESCALGDRRSIDAFIATHGIVADTTDRVLWVSAGPHLSGRFVKVDLREWPEPGATQQTDVATDTLPEDPVAPRLGAVPIVPTGAP